MSNLHSFSVAYIFCRDLARLIGKVGFNCELAVILILSLQLLNAFFAKLLRRSEARQRAVQSGSGFFLYLAVAKRHALIEMDVLK